VPVVCDGDGGPGAYGIGGGADTGDGGGPACRYGDGRVRPAAGVVAGGCGPNGERGGDGNRVAGRDGVRGDRGRGRGVDHVDDASPVPPAARRVLSGPEPWEGTGLFDESDVRLGLVPPPEMVAREMAEMVQSDRRVTPKRWASTWYAERFGPGVDPYAEAVAGDPFGDRFRRGGDGEPVSEADRDDDGDGEAESVSEAVDVEAVRELVRVEGVESVPSVMGRLGIDPARREEVADVIGDCR